MEPDELELVFEDIRTGKIGAIAWGTGMIGSGFGYEILVKNRIKIKNYVDSSSDRWGGTINGIECISPDAVKDKNVACFVLASGHYMEDMCLMAKSIGIKKVVSFVDLCKLQVKDYFDFKKQSKIAVYTCVVGGYDELMIPNKYMEDCDFFIVSDKRPKVNSKFEYLNIRDYIPKDISDYTRMNRYCKINAHRLFPQYRYSIYFDGNVQLNKDYQQLINNLGSLAIKTLGRNFYDDLYIDAMRSIETGRDDKDKIYEQVRRYWLEGMPEHYGSVINTILIREQNNPICRKIMEDWWNEVYEFSARDQISLPYVIWRNGFSMKDVNVVNETPSIFNDNYWKFCKNHIKNRAMVEKCKRV